ncbi:hypothetical protein [Microcystis aeruginosa]|uniref:hypothetical protein n=1 Tax=Microcystis aeruginosa TaxID=1126 RepID=UPI00232FA2AD|nr:hypothetical protein [Microcystis aeruginosa]MDB9417221.1 hypothetical protein [Microcystis aeruginosa CS-556/03]
MKVIFADTFYWIALINPRDNWHTIALDYAQKYADDYLITTDGIIDETLNYFATKGAIMRRKALATYTLHGCNLHFLLKDNNIV